jgi:hypothetical protein
MKNLFYKEQRLIALQVLIFALFLTVTISVGAIVYNKTSIHDVEDLGTGDRSITGGFTNLQKAAE